MVPIAATGFTKDVPKALRIKIAQFKEDATIEDILLSPEMADYLTNLGRTICGVYDETTRVRLIYEDENVTAYMNQYGVVINIKGVLVNFYGTLSNKIMCIIGEAVHEYAHRKYLNLDRMEQIHGLRLKGKWPTSSPSADPYVLDEIEEALNDDSCNGAAARIFAQMAWDINNILADVHDENKVAEEFPGIPAKALAYPQVAMYESVPTFEDEFKRVSDVSDNADKLQFMLSLLLRYARFHDVKIETDDCWENEFVLKLVECMDFIDDGIEEDNVDKRQENVNQILVACWPYIKAVIDEIKENTKDEESESGDGDSESTGSKGSDSKSSSSESGDSGDRKSEIEKRLEKVLEGLKKSGRESRTKTPEGLPKRMEDKDKKKSSSSEEKSRDSKKRSETEESAKERLEKAKKSAPKIEDDGAAERTAEKLKDEFAERKAMEELEGERLSAIHSEICRVDAKGHAGVRVMAKRKTSVTGDMKAKYDAIAKDLLPVSKALQRQIKQTLQERCCDGGKMYGQIYGNRFEDRSIARIDGRYFSKTRLPQDPLKLAVAVLVDESGSMHGEREEAARRMAILCEDFTRGLNIPTLICGHSTEGAGTFALYSYVEFDKIDSNDKYRLVDIHARSQNRDGLALKIMCERLIKRPEEAKLLIVVSDGLPCDYDYGGISAEREMQEICKEYRKKGIAIFAAAIGNDKENIHGIYQEGFLNISDLSKLPREMVGLIRKHIKIY